MTNLILTTYKLPYTIDIMVLKKSISQQIVDNSINNLDTQETSQIPATKPEDWSTLGSGTHIHYCTYVLEIVSPLVFIQCINSRQITKSDTSTDKNVPGKKQTCKYLLFTKVISKQDAENV